MDDEKEIIYIALSNSLSLYKELLEEDNIEPDERELVEYLIERHLNLIDKYHDEITQSTTIKRPKW